jgi:hypothetical protein
MKTIVATNKNLERFQGFFFHCYSKNLKLLSKEMNINYEDINNFLCQVGYKLKGNDEVYVDVGIEIFDFRSPNVLIWDICKLKKFFAVNALSTVKREDIFCHMRGYGGYAAETSITSKAQQKLIYAQAYLCEKEPLYGFNVGKSHYNFNLTDQELNEKSMILNDSFYRAKLHSYGVRIEFRLAFTSWNDYVSVVPCLYKYFHENDYFVSASSTDIYNFKTRKFGDLLSLFKSTRDIQKKQYIACLIEGLVKRLPSGGYFSRLHKLYNSNLLLPDDDIGNLKILHSNDINGRSVEEDIDAEYSEMAISDDPLLVTLEDIFETFLSDIESRIPNQNRYLKTHGSNVNITSFACVSELYMSYISCRGKVIHSKDDLVNMAKYKNGRSWDERFDFYFPTVGREIAASSPWHYLKYYSMYINYVSILSDKKVTKAREWLWSKFSKLEVLPSSEFYGKVWTVIKYKSQVCLKFAYNELL